MQLKNYQTETVEKLLTTSKKLLNKSGIRSCVIKAPTGSGKTIMVAEWLSLLAQERLSKPYAFIWISGNKLHKQSHDKLQDYLHDSRYTLSFLEGISGNQFQENEIVFVNWHSLTKQDKDKPRHDILYASASLS
jgi:type III restriction enzyme